MKNLRKLTRTDLKKLKGGYIKADTFRCCNPSTGSCGPCGGPGACDAGYELRSC